MSRFQEKGNLEVLLFTIQSKLRANNQKPYVPHDGKLISDINKVPKCSPKNTHHLSFFLAFILKLFPFAVNPPGLGETGEGRA